MNSNTNLRQTPHTPSRNYTFSQILEDCEKPKKSLMIQMEINKLSMLLFSRHDLKKIKIIVFEIKQVRNMPLTADANNRQLLTPKWPYGGH